MDLLSFIANFESEESYQNILKRNENRIDLVRKCGYREPFALKQLELLLQKM
jgi:hypothetical protein